MGKDFSYLLNPSIRRNSVPFRTYIENKYFGKFADINNLTRYALAYENFENENKYEFMLKQLRQRQIFQEQQLHEIQSQIDEIDPSRWDLEQGNNLEADIQTDQQHKNKSIFRFKLPKWLLKFKIQFNNNKNNELLIDASCSVCYMSKKNILFTECGHISACTSCSEKLGFKCPMCRKISDSKMLVFY
jgi:hypothetical protein